MGFMAVGAANGLREETLIVEFANNHILGITVISGLLTILAFYLIFKIRKQPIQQEWKLNKFKISGAALASLVAFSFSFLFALCTYDIYIEKSMMIAKYVDFY